MPILQREHVIEVPQAVQTFRWLTATAYGRFLPSEIRDIPIDGKAEPGFETARRTVAEGNGLIVAHTHADKGDPPRVVKMIYNDPVMRRRLLAIPIALHQVKPWQSLVANLLSSPNIPVVTSETQRVLQSRGLAGISREQAHDIMGAYLKQTVGILKEGGIAVIAPQGTRQPYLGELTSAISTLVNRSTRAGVENLAIMFVGTQIFDQKRYPNPSSINHGVLYRLNIGNCFSLERLLQEANGKISQIDAVVKRELTPLVAPNYLLL